MTSRPRDPPGPVSIAHRWTAACSRSNVSPRRRSEAARRSRRGSGELGLDGDAHQPSLRPRRPAPGGVAARDRGDRAGPGRRPPDRARIGRREPDHDRHRAVEPAGRHATRDRRPAGPRAVGGGRAVRRHQGRLPRRQVRPDLDPHPSGGLADVRPRDRRGRGPDRRPDRGPPPAPTTPRRRARSCSSSSTTSTGQAWLAMWRAAAAAGYDVRILDHGDLPRRPLAGPARDIVQPGLRPAPGPDRARRGSRPVPDRRHRGWLIDGGEAVAPLAGDAVDGSARSTRPTSPRSRPADVEGLVIRPVERRRGDATGSRLSSPGSRSSRRVADAWRGVRADPRRARGYRQFVAELDGRAVVRRRP